MPVRLKFDGLDELVVALRNVPERLADQASDIVIRHAEVAETRLKQIYPPSRNPSGRKRHITLREGVKLDVDINPFGTIAILRSTSPLAHLWEFGTKNRVTQADWKRGAGPPHHGQGVITIASDERHRMNMELVQLLIREGFQITQLQDNI